MKILVDTCIWSLALRRSSEQNNAIITELYNLISEARVQIIGPVRQELLSGIRREKDFKRLKSYLSAFPDLPLLTEDFELAAQFFNVNRAKGIQGSNTDFLICAIANRTFSPIFSIDKDFELYRNHIPIELHKFA